MGQIKCKMNPPPQTSVCAPLPVFGCVVTPVLSCHSLPLPRLVCLCLSGVLGVQFQWCSALFEKREKSLVSVGDAVGSSGRLTAAGPRRP